MKPKGYRLRGGTVSYALWAVNADRGAIRSNVLCILGGTDPLLQHVAAHFYGQEQQKEERLETMMIAESKGVQGAGDVASGSTSLRALISKDDDLPRHCPALHSAHSRQKQSPSRRTLRVDGLGAHNKRTCCVRAML
jgi:hypothetical protein